MKIKELHLRNIASIETADIDFSKDLTDTVTGTPASVFLISGDTGAGKSVILDGISMALYKTTPRLSGVSNANRNEFSDNTGESIRVNSIEQYTRIGISADDDCYSEVVFEGNDGVEYCARLTLGMYHTRGDRRLQHHAPVWKVKCGNGDWIDRDKDVSATIQAAVGLSFEQFGRMAMLAQGQFASFLTGDKKEREAILEQLTSTEHFSAYGAAIKSLFDRAKAALSTAKTAYNTEKSHTLEQCDLDDLVNKKTENEARQKDLESRAKANLETINLVTDLDKARKAFGEAKKKRDDIQAIKDCQEYKDADALVKDWDATSTQRQRLEDMHTAETAIGRARKSEDALKKTFATLAADLEARRLDAEKAAAENEDRIIWLQERKDRDDLYSAAEAFDVRLANHINAVRDLVANESRKLDETGRTAGLETALTETRDAVVKAAGEVKKKQDEIDALIEKRKQLEPERVNNELKTGNARLALLERMKAAADAIDSDRQAADALMKKNKADEQSLEQLRREAESAQDAYDIAKRNDADAVRALTTMQMSLDEKIVELRKCLTANHTDTCPLCGQHISEIHLDKEFKGMLSPLEEMQKNTSAALRTAEKKRNEVQKAFSTADGALKTNKKAHENALNEIKAKVGSLAANAVMAGLDTTGDAAGQIGGAIDGTKERIKTLMSIQLEAERLQKTINDLLIEKSPLDTAKAEAERKENDARAALEKNRQLIEGLTAEHTKLRENIDSLATEISAAMGTAYPGWENDTEAVRQTLKTDAGEYNKTKKSAGEASSALKLAGILIDSIKGQMNAVREKHADWPSQAEPLAYSSRDIISEWNVLSGKVQSTAIEIAGYEKTIADCRSVLDEYYAATGKKEEGLAAVGAKKDKVEKARSWVRETGEILRSSEDDMKRQTEKISETMKKLCADSYEDITALADLEAARERLAKELEEVHNSLGVIKEKLNADSQNKTRLKALEAELEKATIVHAKWDKLNSLFGGTRLRTLVQTYILRPLLNNANVYLQRITDRYTLTCSEDNEQLSILVLDRYNKNQVRSVTVLSGGERFMISLALSLALSSLNRPDMNVDILFIDEGFGTLDEKNLDSVMQTLERLQEIAGGKNRRVGIISHREELDERIPVQIHVVKKGEGRSQVTVRNS